MITRALALALLSLLVLMPATSSAQEIGRVNATMSTGTAYGTFARPGEATVQVVVMGSVSRPGIYEVGERTNVGQLLALAGGILQQPRSARERHDITVRLFTQDGNERRLAFEGSFDDILTANGGVPVGEGDVLTVDTVVRKRPGWGEVLRTTASVATLFIAVERLLRYARDN